MTNERVVAVGESMKKLLLQGAGMGGGATVIYFIIDLVKADPQLASAAINKILDWGPMFGVFAIGAFIVDKRFGEMIQLGRDNVAAQQQMADAMREIANKDDRQAELLRRETSFLGSQQEKILEKLDTTEQQNVDILTELKRLMPGEEARSAHA